MGILGFENTDWRHSTDGTSRQVFDCIPIPTERRHETETETTAWCEYELYHKSISVESPGQGKTNRPLRLDTAGNWRSSLRASKKYYKKINVYLLMYRVILTDCTITIRDFSRECQNLQSWIASSSFKSRLTALQNPNSRKMFHTARFNIAYLVPADVFFVAPTPSTAVFDERLRSVPSIRG